MSLENEKDGTIPVTLIVPTFNEEKNIEKCLQSADGFIDQIFVIDSDSEDGTVEIAGRYADDVVNLSYFHNMIIPWIYQWGLENLPIRNDWVMILEADQEITPGLKRELRGIFDQPHIPENGFYVKRRQIFRGKLLRFGGYGGKYMLKLFRRRAGKLDKEEQDTRVYVDGRVGKLENHILEHNRKEAAILFYLEKHLRYAEAFAREELKHRQNLLGFKQKPKLFGTPDQRTLWLKSVYYRLPLYLRPFAYFFYRYVLLLGFLDGKQGAIFHFLRGFWWRLVVDIRLEELMRDPQALQEIASDKEQIEKEPVRASPQVTQ